MARRITSFVRSGVAEGAGPRDLIAAAFTIRRVLRLCEGARVRTYRDRMRVEAGRNCPAPIGANPDCTGVNVRPEIGRRGVGVQ